MNKSELVDLLSENDNFDTKASAKRALEAVVDGIQEGLLEDGKVQLVGFGSFNVKERSARMGRNPRTGERIHIPASKTVGFRVGKHLKEAVQD